jgi:peroxiredoxin Q/BCP
MRGGVHVANLKIGDKAPEFTAETDQGETISLAGLRGKKVVLYFYPRDNTAGCTIQACSFRDSYTDFTAKDAVVLGVSPDNARSHQKFREKHSLPFPLLLDMDHSIANAYGVWGERKFMGKAYMGIQRSHFVIDEDGVLTDVQYGIKPFDSAKKSLAALG